MSFNRSSTVAPRPLPCAPQRCRHVKHHLNILHRAIRRFKAIQLQQHIVLKHLPINKAGVFQVRNEIAQQYVNRIDSVFEWDLAHFASPLHFDDINLVTRNTFA